MLYSKIQDQLIDLNLNRLSEGLKVLEDIARFYIKNEDKLSQIRAVKRNLWRHFGETRKQVIWERNSQHDLGRPASFDINKRGNVVDMLTANFKRCQEASRVLEETYKTVNPKQVKILKDLRFTLYDVEKELLTRVVIQFELKIYCILDIATIGRKYISEITKACIAGGATTIQLREPKDTITKQWLSDARKIKNAITNPKVKLIINNRADVARAINADGIHIGKEDIPIEQARDILGDDKIIGVTVRNIKDALTAEKKGADYISVGSIFASPSKPSAPVVGIKTLAQVVKAVKIPVTAIGGITTKNSKEIFKTGASGIAIVSSVFQGIDFSRKTFIKKIIRNLKKIQQETQT